MFFTPLKKHYVLDLTKSSEKVKLAQRRSYSQFGDHGFSLLKYSNISLVNRNFAFYYWNFQILELFKFYYAIEISAVLFWSRLWVTRISEIRSLILRQRKWNMWSLKPDCLSRKHWAAHPEIACHLFHTSRRSGISLAVCNLSVSQSDRRRLNGIPHWAMYTNLYARI